MREESLTPPPDQPTFSSRVRGHPSTPPSDGDYTPSSYDVGSPSTKNPNASTTQPTPRSTHSPSGSITRVEMTRRSTRLRFAKQISLRPANTSSLEKIDWRDIPPAEAPTKKKRNRSSTCDEDTGRHIPKEPYPFSRLAALVTDENVRNAQQVTRLRAENEKLKHQVEAQQTIIA